MRLGNRLHSLQRIVYVLLMMAFSSNGATANQPIEQQIRQFVSAHQQEQLSLLEKLVNINSGTSNIPGVRKVGSILASEFETLGFKLRWEEEPPSMQRAGTLIAEHPGKKGRRLLLIGHLDTVFPINSPFQQFKREANFAMGPGVVDDKGGDIVILYALKALQANNLLNDANVTVVLTGDEEDSGKPTSISRKPLKEVAKHCDIALDFEGAVTMDTATIARRGITNWVMTSQGTESHSSQIFQQGVSYGAIYELVRILDTMREQLAGEKYLSFNPGFILGGTSVDYDNKDSRGEGFGKGNVIAKAAVANGDLRFISEQQKEAAQQKIAAIINSHLTGTNAVIRFQDGIPAMSPTESNLKLLEKYSQASSQLGYGAIKPLDPVLRGAGDISFIASEVEASLAGLGPAGSGIHSEKETLDIASLGIQTERAALLIYQLTQEN